MPRSRLLEDGHAEPGHVFEGEPEVRAADFLQFLLVVHGGDTLHQPFRILGRQRVVAEKLEVAVHAPDRRAVHGNVQVGPVPVHQHAQQTDNFISHG